MEGSSHFGWQRSDNRPPGLNSSFLDTNPTRIPGTNTSASHDSGSVLKGGDRNLWSHINNYKNQAAAGTRPATQPADSNDVSLRQWLDNPERKVDGLECLNIFSQIVAILNPAHSQGIIVHSVMPSCFVMSAFNRVSFVESGPCSDSGSESQEYGVNSETSYLQSYSGWPFNALEATGDNNQALVNELNWYTSPEEGSGGVASCASDIYQLGVLLFELFCEFGSVEEKSSTMVNLEHRVLPPQLLLKWHKEAMFCLWLLHPDPSSRPKMGELLQSELLQSELLQSELLQSEFLNESRIDIGESEAAIKLREEIEEQELLLDFLLKLQQTTQDAENSLKETVSFVSSDTDEVTKLQAALNLNGGSKSNSNPPKNLPLNPHLTNIRMADDDDCGFSSSGKRKRPGLETNGHKNLETPDGNQETALSKSSRLIENFQKVESAYFLTRSRSVKPASWPLGRHSLISSEKSSISNPSSKECDNVNELSGWINTFFEGMCKYLTFNMLKVKADVKQGDLLNSPNMVCSLSFDRDGEFLATAGVNKKIKVFEYNSIANGECDIHYPVVEMASQSKFSSICWNGYMKSHIASSNIEGVVQVWDVRRSQAFMEMKEHEQRVWSVDFSLADPTLLASGSDDGSVKLWNINQRKSVDTIWANANVCCVQFPKDYSRALAFGSVDQRIYYYDLRNSKEPLCTLVGHDRAVTYVKFIDSTTLVSASTDNTIKLWDLSMCTSGVIDSPLQSFTGHENTKHFVGLSVSEDYIATGSETNEVFVYHKAFPMPAMSFKFKCTDPYSGDEVDDSGQFISSVCWRGKSSTLVVGNSTGDVKLLEMA